MTANYQYVEQNLHIQ